MASVINPNALEALSTALKYHYPREVIEELIRKDSPLLDMCEQDKSFRQDLGGRSLIFPLIMDRPHNFGVGTETSYFPGFSGSTNDDINRISLQEGSMSRAYAYGDVAFTEQQMASVHKDFELFSGWGFARHVKMMQDDFKSHLEWMLLGDGTGIVGKVHATTVPVAVGGNTVVTLAPVSGVDKRGVLGTMRLNKNQRVSIIKAADWATNPRTALIHSDIGGSGTAFHKIVATSGIHDRAAAPTITLSGDLTGGTAIAVGDILVEANSRASNAAGGNAASEALATLKCFQGIQSLVDDGDLTASLYGITRSSNTILNSITSLNTGVAKKLDWQTLQVLMDRLHERRGSDDTDFEKDYYFFTNRAVATGYIAAEGEAAKRYIQEAKARTLVTGFKSATMAFVGNDTLMPWIRLNTMPAGHGFLLQKKGLRVMWDIPPGIIDTDSLKLRMIQGTPTYYLAMQAVGNFRIVNPWFDARLTGLEGAYTA